MKKLLLVLLTVFSVSSYAQPLKIAGFGNNVPTALFQYHSKLYFSAAPYLSNDEQLYIYDKALPISATNPKLLVDLDTTTIDPAYPRNFAIHNNKLYFSSNFGNYVYDDAQPISMDNPMNISGVSAVFTSYNGKLYFETHGMNDRTVFVFDDSQPVSLTNPHELVSTAIKTIITSNTYDAYVYQNKLFFSATDATTTGDELWVYDDAQPISTSNPRILADINQGINSNAFYNGSTPNNFIEYKGDLYFSANDGSGTELWHCTGANTPTKVGDIDQSPYGGQATYKAIYNDTLYFGAHENLHGWELWGFDAQNVPAIVADVNPGSSFSIPSNLIVFGNKLFFNADDGTTGRELWMYDNAIAPSATNPRLVVDLYPGTGNGIVQNNNRYTPAVYGKRLYFGGEQNSDIGALWALTLCNIGAAQPPVFNLGNDTTIQAGQTITLTGPGNMDGYQWQNNTTASQLSVVGDVNNLGQNLVALTVTDTNECVYSDTIQVTVVNAPTGIQPTQSRALDFKAYPNPTNGVVNIRAGFKIEELTVTDYLGQLIYTGKPLQANTAFTIENSGLYFIKLTTATGQTATQKIVVCR